MDSVNLSVEYTLALLAWLDLRIRAEVARLRQGLPEREDEAYRGLYISDEEVDGLLKAQIPTLAGMQRLPEDQERALQTAEQAASDRVVALERQAQAEQVELRLNRVVTLFGLSEIEREILILCLAPEIDLKYERLYAYLQDDVTKKRPTLDLAFRLLCRTLEERLAARRVFEPGAPLLEWSLVSLHDDPGARRPALPARYLKLDDRIAGYLLGSDQIDGRLLELADRVEASQAGVSEEIRHHLQRWATAWDHAWKETAPVILFHGQYGSGRHAAAGYLAHLLRKPLLKLSLDGLANSGLRIEQAVRLAEREALLSDGVICWSQEEDLLQADADPEAARERAAFVRAIAGGQALVVLLAGKAWEPARDLRGRPFLRLEFQPESYAARKVAWAAALDGANPFTDEELNTLAGRFRLTTGQIQDAVARARTLMWSRDPQAACNPAGERLQASDIDAAARGQSQHRLGQMARKLEARYTWEDIVLPRPQLNTLQMICATIRQRPVVYGDWGFDRKLSLGKGAIALFSGLSGTGKTMSAEIISNELGLDLYKINLSAVVSKYIGETEKNLERIFSEAQNTDAILFFDEADALFGKRSEVKDAHDRYANIETAYLLQRTEEYSGLVILASNIKKNMDEAFIRRIHFLVEFPFPEEPERLEIWKRTFPPQAPRSADIDLVFLARKLKIAGGNIRNIILAAAFLAAEDQGPIAMRHLVRAAGYEFQKMGRMVVEADFEQYFDLVRF
jgi:hypothetical protein